MKVKCDACDCNIVIRDVWNKKGRKHFCSECKPRIIKSKHQQCVCCICNKHFVTKFISSFCSKECYADYLGTLKETDRNGRQESAPVIFICEYLSAKGIEFKREITFDDLTYIGKLRYDIGIYRNNQLYCLVEYDGRQHYQPVWGGTAELKRTRQRDKLKDMYARENNIKLIRIPYYTSDIIQSLESDLQDLI